jgi:hypothetical protein
VAFGLPDEAFEIVVIKVTGDQILDKPLKEIGGKGLFTREIEEALIDGGIDIAVHSMKDMPTLQPEGLVLDCYLPREDVRDGFVSPGVASLADLPLGAVVGSSSLRRRAQLALRRPDLKLVEFRGNVQTRMRKLEEGVAVATFLAMAGLNRLGMAHVARAAIAPEEMLPAVAQASPLPGSSLGPKRRLLGEEEPGLQGPRPRRQRRGRRGIRRRAARETARTTRMTTACSTALRWPREGSDPRSAACRTLSCRSHPANAFSDTTAWTTSEL